MRPISSRIQGLFADGLFPHLENGYFILFLSHLPLTTMSVSWLPLSKRWQERVWPPHLVVGSWLCGFMNCLVPPSESCSLCARVKIQESLFAPSRKFYKLLGIYKISYFWCDNKLGKESPSFREI
jgi:hypothetical protein